ncbi:2'-5' RNA ligase family protein [Maricaulis sp.]|uniref:2'-5' RNA ligase family protein n=1 Tax=Maricaulis sp. TaxID=1486257 RepID=UPI003A949F99
MPAETLCVLLCPEFALADYEQIQLWRREHDTARADLLLPHFTLVDPVTGWNPGEFAREIEARLPGQNPFGIVLDRAVSHQDEGGGEVADWLVPGPGREALEALQDRLCSGALAGERRAAPARRPHITIGRDSDAAASQARVKAINEGELSIHCLASAVQIVRIKGERVKLLERIPLGRES